MIKLDYTLQSLDDRVALVNKIVEENPNLSDKYCEILSDYLVFCMDKEEKRQKNITTENRLATINKRETSFEALAAQFESGEDGVYDLIVENDKNVIFRPKIEITQEDVDNIPELQQIREAINYWEERLKTATGKEAYIIKKAIIDFRKDQYFIKDAILKPTQVRALTKPKHDQKLSEELRAAPDSGIEAGGVSLMRPQVCQAILQDYVALKHECDGAFHTDLWALMSDFDDLMRQALSDEPILRAIIQCKIKGMQNTDIQKYLIEKYQQSYSVEYISSLWNKKIPQVLASYAEDNYLNWYYTEVEKGQYKKCGRCGEIKLANTKYYSRNSAGKDGWYSICKACRNKKK